MSNQNTQFDALRTGGAALPCDVAGLSDFHLKVREGFSAAGSPKAAACRADPTHHLVAEWNNDCLDWDVHA